MCHAEISANASGGTAETGIPGGARRPGTSARHALAVGRVAGVVRAAVAVVAVKRVGDTIGIVMLRGESAAIGESFAHRLAGRVATEDIKHGKAVIVEALGLITDEEEVA